MTLVLPDFAAKGSVVLSSLSPAQLRQRIHNLPRPLRHLVLAQSTLVRLKPHPQQDRILPSRDRATPENLNGMNFPKLGYTRSFHGPLHLFKGYFVAEDEGKVPLNSRIFSQGCKSHRMQPHFVKL